MTDSQKKLCPVLCFAMTGLYSLIMTIIMLTKYINIVPMGGLAIVGLWIVNLVAPILAIIAVFDGDSKAFILAIIGAWIVALVGTILLFIALNVNISNYLVKHGTESELGTSAFWYFCFFGASLGANMFMIVPLIGDQKPKNKNRSLGMRFVRYSLFFFIGLIPSALFQTIAMSGGGGIAIFTGILYPILCYFAMGFLSASALKSAGLSRPN